VEVTEAVLVQGPVGALKVRCGGVGGVVEGVLVPCGPAAVTRIELLIGSLGYDPETAPRAWQVDFDPPNEVVGAFEIGGDIPGGQVRVPFNGLPPDTDESGPVLQVVLADGREWSESVTRPEDLADVRLRFQSEFFSAEDFEEQSRCE
jgi:hypothetical protein